MSQKPFNNSWSSEYYAKKWNRMVSLTTFHVDKKVHAGSVGSLNLL